MEPQGAAAAAGEARCNAITRHRQRIKAKAARAEAAMNIMAKAPSKPHRAECQENQINVGLKTAY